MVYRAERAEEFEIREKNGVWIYLVIVLGLTILFSALFDFFFVGAPLGFVIPLVNQQATISKIIYYVSISAVGVYVGFLGLRELIFERKFSVEFLMSVAAFGALYLQFQFEAATVLLLYSLSEYFEDYIEDRARRTVEKLSAFMPDSARVLFGYSERSITVRDVLPGMTILIKPGERIALDGTVIDGYSFIDQSLVTGESTPLLRKSGDNVYAGTLNTSGILKIVVNRKAEDTLVSKIVKLVIESRKRKASIEKLVDRFARVYVPIVIVLALCTAILIPRVVGGLSEVWLYRSLILLVVSCPSAFIVSVPATVFTAITAAARRGVIIKGGVYVEKMDQVKAVLFDKTGTLTLGKPSVQEIKTIEETDERALMYAAALEQFSNHAAAQAVVRKASERNLDYSKLDVKGIEEVPGKGMIGYVNGMHVAVGNMELMKQYECDCRQINVFYENELHTAVCVSIAKIGIASVCLIDDVRKDAVEVIDSLKKAGIFTAILTGDKSEIAKETAERLNVDEVYSELFPEDKLQIVDQMKAKFGLIAMVGDGVNDAPALAASDVGIAMGGGGVDVALESADIVLVNDELIQIPYLCRLSSKTVSIAKQNIAAALAVKVVLGILGLLGFAPLWFTVASGDDGITLLILLNTMRLTRMRS
ncbi:MAG: cation-translocating P-type ATPase [Candidatus Bathyarchaeota archaeon]